jgi:hypothetical protein
MHKTFYASGFLYHSSSQQILLQQHTYSSSSLSLWSLFGESYTEKEEAQSVFKKTIDDLLGIPLDIVYPVYSYFNESAKANQVIFYSEVESLQQFPAKNGRIFEWFSFKTVLKLPTTKQTKHDIVVGQRVINAALRRERGEHSF